MEMSAATYRFLDPTNLNNFVNPLRLPGDEGLFAFLDASEVVVSSDLDGIHLEAGEHRKLGEAVADRVRSALG